MAKWWPSKRPSPEPPRLLTRGPRSFIMCFVRYAGQSLPLSIMGGDGMSNQHFQQRPTLKDSTTTRQNSKRKREEKRRAVAGSELIIPSKLINVSFADDSILLRKFAPIVRFHWTCRRGQRRPWRDASEGKWTARYFPLPGSSGFCCL